MALASGTRLGPYEIIDPLGAGGMGEVYRARDPRLGRNVALKVLSAAVALDAAGLERFAREARAVAALNHPHIVTIYSTEEAGGVHFLTMELVEGQTVDAIIPPGGLALPKFLEIAIPLADALTAAHQKQITHRDLKPGNVMITGDGRVKVLDFGLARVGELEATGGSTDATRAVLTQEGTIVWTMPYMSPEQIAGGPVDHRSDLFSLGIMFYEMVTGVRPFAGDSSPLLMSAILRDTPVAVNAQRADVPEPLARLIARCLEKRPDDRVQTARDVYNELRYVQKVLDSGIARRPDSGSRPAAPEASFWIAVLPFTSTGGDMAAESMASGLTDDITAGLSRFSTLSVVAQPSAPAFQGTSADVRQAADRLGARYVVVGSVRKAGHAVRISSHLIDARSGAQMWSETYNRDAVSMDVFTIQDDVTDRIVATVADRSGVLVRSMIGSIRSTPPEQLSAHRLVLRCWGHHHRPTAEEHSQLRSVLESRVGADPHHADLWAELSRLYCVEHAHGFNPLPDSIGRALRAARRAVALDPASQSAWEVLAIASFYARDEAGFLAAAERTIQLNPRNTEAVAWVGTLFTHKGEYDRGCDLIDRAMALNPHHPGWYHFAAFNRHFKRREFAEALAAARRVNMPDFLWPHFSAAAAAGHLDRRADAAVALEALEALAPAMLDEAVRHDFISRWYWDDDFIALKLDGLNRAIRLARPAAQPSSGVDVSPSIAVLPFTDLSAARDQDWFCDGMAEEILNALAQLPGLRVAARTSAFALRGKGDDLAAIGEKLHVTSVLEGSVRRSGDRVRITAQLSDAAKGFQVWSERYDRELRDIFDVQDEIARAIADRLRVTLAGSRGGRLVAPTTSSMEAYELLLKGRVLQTRRGRSILDALACFEHAVELDPALAEAHALQGDAYRLLALYGLAPATEMMPRARAAAERALALDPRQVEALATLANVAAVFEWDLAASLALTDRALAVDPSHVRTLAEGAICAASMEKLPPELERRVLRAVRRAREIDPLNAWAAAVEAFTLAYTGRPEEAIMAARHALTLDPNNFSAHWAHVWALAAAARHAEALAAAEAALAMSGRNPRILTEVAAILAARGDVDGAEAVHQELRERAKTTYIGWSEQAAAAASAGHLVEARALLARSVAAREPYLVFWKLPGWAAVRADPEGLALLHSTGVHRWNGEEDDVV